MLSDSALILSAITAILLTLIFTIHDVYSPRKIFQQLNVVSYNFHSQFPRMSILLKEYFGLLLLLETLLQHYLLQLLKKEALPLAEVQLFYNLPN